MVVFYRNFAAYLDSGVARILVRGGVSIKGTPEWGVPEGGAPRTPEHFSIFRLNFLLLATNLSLFFDLFFGLKNLYFNKNFTKSIRFSNSARIL